MGSDKDVIYDNIVYDYKVMDDAPYRLDAAELRSMQKMERALNFILNNIKSKEIEVSKAAEQAGYEESYFIKAFKKYYEMPFQTFVTKLKLRKAALEIQNRNYPKQIGVDYGFSSVQSFSKAFKREIGIPPREFFRGNYNVPDMPIRKQVSGLEVKLEYHEEHALSAGGISILPPKGNDTYFMDAYALAYKMNHHECRRNEQHDKIGIWWYGLDEGMKYVFGDVSRYYDSVYVPEEESVAGDILIQGGNYAVFSYARPEDSSKIGLYSRIMARYIFKEWVPMNAKVTNTIGYTYEKFTSERVYIYVPIAMGMGTTDEIKPRKWSIPSWAKYIDEHIKDPLNLESLAIIAGYSPQNYRDVFTMYYDMTPTTYIRRRKLSLAINELKHADLKGNLQSFNALQIIREFGFSSYSSFRDAFMDEFGVEPDSDVDTGEMPDAEEYYEKNNTRVKFRIKVLSGFKIIMHSIEEAYGEELPADLTGRVLYWFHRDFRDFLNIQDYIQKPVVKVSIWGNDAVYEENHKVYKYYVGSVLKDTVNKEDLQIILGETGAVIENIPGGKYAIFQTVDNNDNAKPELAYHLLTLTAFGGWINENRWRTDLNRRTFVVWQDNKFSFYVPVVR